MRYREDITDGLENAPQAFIGMLGGRNFGKAIVRVAPMTKSARLDIGGLIARLTPNRPESNRQWPGILEDPARGSSQITVTIELYYDSSRIESNMPPSSPDDGRGFSRSHAPRRATSTCEHVVRIDQTDRCRRLKRRVCGSWALEWPGSVIAARLALRHS